MSYTKNNSLKGFEVIRQLLLNATNETLDVQTVVDDTELSAIIPNEQERLEFISKRGSKEWLLSEDTKFAGSFTIAGLALGGDVTFKTLNETFIITASAGQTETDIASALVTAINGSSDVWTSTIIASGVVRVIPLSDVYPKAGFQASSTDAGLTVTAKSPNEAPIDIQLGGTIQLNGRNKIFQGTSFRTPIV